VEIKTPIFLSCSTSFVVKALLRGLGLTANTSNSIDTPLVSVASRFLNMDMFEVHDEEACRCFCRCRPFRPSRDNSRLSYSFTQEFLLFRVHIGMIPIPLRKKENLCYCVFLRWQSCSEVEQVVYYLREALDTSFYRRNCLG
jgi:hypothetical protein